MTYFLLAPDNTLPFVYGDAKFSPIDQGVYSNLWNDRKLPAEACVDIHLTKSKAKLTRDIFSVNAGFVGSEKLVRTLTQDVFNTKINPVPAKVFYHSGEEVKQKYFFLEFDCWIDAFDYEDSRYKAEIDGTERRIIECEKMVIDARKTRGLDWFFLMGAEFFDPVISAALASKIRSEKISGLRIIAVEDYTWEGL